MANKITPLFILDQKRDEYLQILEHYTVDEWRAFTEQWHSDSETISGSVLAIREASRCKPHSKRVRLAKKLIEPSEPSSKEDDFTTRRFRQLAGGAIENAIETTVLFYALTDDALARAMEALRQNGKLSFLDRPKL